MNSFIGSSRTYYETAMSGRGNVGSKNYPKYRERLKDTIILNTSYENVIKEYDSPTTFFYLDPPYENSKKTTSSRYESIDYTQLRDTLKSIQGKFLLSINDSPFIRELFKDFTIEEVETRYCLKQRRVVELLIKNY
jgi:DNA adenine methylase